ncbi:hypothetical protein [Rhodococcus sp. SGAir0479]|uniref:hypothetical protein n=1 Tax=Rhodococcus sp. SGAir0479 TaxID=2567884 RepID=UPI0010CCF3A9|nr:hypothetical protein [Rhodococcus sp. SGAir0479]QCQ91723.1 hypothetical protein E7742_11095 [Rhodococcus sp. SGAir0479]
MTFFPDDTANVVLVGPGAAQGLPERAWYLSEHHLVGRRDCGAVLAPGWADYQEPKGIHQWFKSARGDGARWLGAVMDPREFFLPVYVHEAFGRPFQVVNDGFWSDIDYIFESQLQVYTKTFGLRYIDIRLADQPRIADKMDPAFDRFVPYLVPVISGNSYWSGIEETREWSNGQSTERLKIYNSGDRKAYPEWVVKGPGIFRIPDGDTVVTTPMLKAGEVALFHTDPSKRLAKSNMRPNLYGDMGAQRFRNAVPGRTWFSLKKLTVIAGNAASSAVCTIRPKSRRPR